MLESKFPFIKDNMFLIAQVDASSEKQFLVMQKINFESKEIELEYKIECIHTATTLQQEFSIWPDNFEEPDLSLDEKFFAMKSWVQGIVEMGFDSVLFQHNFDSIQYPIANTLLKFLVRADGTFIPNYIENASNECVFEGKLHAPSYFAKLLPIINKVSFSLIPEPYLINFIYDEKNRIYYPKDSKIWSELLMKYNNNLSSIKKCDDKELLLLQRLQPQIIINFLSRLREEEHLQMNGNDEFYEMYFKIVKIYEHTREIDGEMTQLLKILPFSYFLDQDLPEYFLGLISIEENYTKLREIVEKISENTFEITPAQRTRLFIQYSYILRFVNVRSERELLKSILHSIPIDVFFKNQNHSLIWFLQFLERHSYQDKFLISLYAQATLEDIKMNLSNIHDFLVLDEDSHIIPRRDGELEFNPLVGIYRYFSVDDLIFPAFLNDSREFLYLLLENIPNQLLFQHISLSEFAELTGDFDFIPSVLKKFIPLTSEPEFDLFLSIGILKFIGATLTTAIIFSDEPRVHSISRKIRESCFRYVPKEEHRRVGGVYVLDNIEEIIQLVMKFDLPIDLQKRLEYLKKMYLKEDWRSRSY